MTDEAKLAPTPTAPGSPVEAPLAPGTDAPKPAISSKPAGLPELELARLTDEVIGALKTVYDPEIPADIYEIGLVYRVDIADDRAVTVDMTLTSPNCPAAGELPGNVENAVASVQGVGPVKVNVTFEPPWDQSRMSDEARVALNLW